MYFKTIKIESFGPYNNWEEKDLSSGLNIILGPNEGGKSTLFHFLSTLIYGFSPANLEQHPYAPWDAPGKVGGEGEVFLETGKTLQVFRRLLSSPQGRLLREGKKENLHNRPLPWITGISRHIFHEVYALTLDKMDFFKDASWEDVQDRLLGSLGASFLLPTGQVLDSLEDEAKGFWREDKRGKPIYKELTKELNSCRKEINQLKDEEKQRKEKDRRLQELKLTLQDLKEKRADLKTKLYKANRLNPLRKKLDRLDELEQRGSLLKVPADFPQSPMASLQHLEEKIVEKKKRADELETAVEKAWQSFNLFGDKEELVLKREKDILDLNDEKPVEIARRDNIKRLEKELQKEEKKGEVLGEDILNSSFYKTKGQLRALSKGELKERMERWFKAKDNWKAARERLNVFSQNLRAEDETDAPLVKPRAIIAAAVGALFLLAAFVVNWIFFFPAAAGFGVAAALLVFSRLWRKEKEKNKGQLEREKKRQENELSPLEDEVFTAKQAFSRSLQGLPLAEVHLEEPRETMMNQLFALQDLACRLEDNKEEQEQLRAESRRWEEKAKSLGKDLGFDISTSSLDLIYSMMKLLEDAREKKKSSLKAETELKQLNRQLKLIKEDISELESKHLFINNTFSAWGDGDVEKGKELFKGQEKAKQVAEELKNQLKIEYPDVESLKNEIEEAEATHDAWLFSDEELVEAEDRLQGIEEELEKLKEEETALRTELDVAASSVTPAELAGKKEMLQERMKEAAVNRDRLCLLSGIIKEAERRFRKEHQPDVLCRAGNYLRHISRGRYTDLYLEEEGCRLVAQRGEDPYPIPVQHPISRGTLDQIYLALRLALVDHLDDHQEKMPLFLDEVLVNWDEKRLQKGIELLKNIAGKRQVFFFTCHDQLAQLIASQAGARIIKLA